MEILPPQKIKVKDVKGMGRGVFATQDIKENEVIEHCPILPISKKEADFIQKSSDIIKHYYLFQYEINQYCIMLGYGSLYNHSKNPNADVDYDLEGSQKLIIFKAIKDIPAGQEILYDYEFDNDKEDFLDLP